MVTLQIHDGNEVLSRLWANLIATGYAKKRLDSTRTGMLLSAIATEINVALSIVESYANQFTLATATDRNIIESLARMFTVRRLASKSKAVLTFYRIDNYNESIKIPAGFAVQSVSDSKIVFKTIADVYLWKGMDSVTVFAYSINNGKGNNVPANTLIVFQNNGYNQYIGVTNTQPAYGGHNDESLEHMRGRAYGFRYERDGTLRDIRRQMYMLGVQESEWTAIEYEDEHGIYQICIDVDSEYDFENICKSLRFNKTFGITPVYKQASRIYVDMYIHIDTTGDVDYTPIQKEQLYSTVNTTIQRFFATYCSLGADLSVNRLKANLNSALNEYNIMALDIDFGVGTVVNSRNMITVNETTRLYPNKILTSLTYNGDN